MLSIGFNIFIIIFINGYFINQTVGYYPGLRRPPSISSLEDPNDILTQLIEEHARRRFQQQLAQQQFYNHHHHNNLHNNGPNIDIIDPESSYSNNNNGPGFSYNFPDTSINNLNDDIDDDGIQFAVNPSDPRYYEGRPNINNGLMKNLNIYENEYRREDSSQIEETLNDNDGNDDKIIKDVQYYKPKNPMNVNPKPTSQQQFLPKPFRGRDDIKKLVQKLEAEGKANAILNNDDQHHQLQQQQQLQQIPGNGINQKNNELVVKERMGMNSDMGMYMVALLAGITAAVIVGIMALVVAWITLQKRTKAAADVEYPAYGVTGPNKDISPSGDRRLAQSAQMYHYQHQKQQIIAMENRQSGSEHHSGGLSDVESDDDNEEGDYTVYECPGLAPTGEMEVKNPLFVDDTPITPITNITTTAPTSTPSTDTTTAVATDDNKILQPDPATTTETIFQKVQKEKSPMKQQQTKQTQPPPAPQRKPPRTNGSNNSTTTGNKNNKSVK